jgi:hypothetical protein
MIDIYPQAMKQRITWTGFRNHLPIHLECMQQCRSAILSKCIELYPESLVLDSTYEEERKGCLPLHLLLYNTSASIEDALTMIDKYPEALKTQGPNGCLPIHVECICQCRYSILSKCIELYPECLRNAAYSGNLPLHCVLQNKRSSVDVALMFMGKNLDTLKHKDTRGKLPIDIECENQCRSIIISKCIELYPECLSMTEIRGFPILNGFLVNESSSVDATLVMIEAYPDALKRPYGNGWLPIHMECMKQCRSTILSRCIELCPESLAKPDSNRCIPLHHLLYNVSSSIEDALIMMDKYPDALKHPDRDGNLPIHIECNRKCRSTILSRCIELCPESLAKPDDDWHLPLHQLLRNRSSSIDDALILINRYPEAVTHRGKYDEFPIHIECDRQCRSIIISRCIELCPESLAKPERSRDLPLNRLLRNRSSSIDDALMMINKYPEAVTHRGRNREFPIHNECRVQCRSTIIAKCIELCPESIDEDLFMIICCKVDRNNFQNYASVLSLIFNTHPMSLYNPTELHDIRHDLYYRRKILNLLPRHVFTPTMPHDADSRDLNWQPRAAMMMLFGQIQQQSRSKSLDVEDFQKSIRDFGTQRRKNFAP